MVRLVLFLFSLLETVACERLSPYTYSRIANADLYLSYFFIQQILVQALQSFVFKKHPLKSLSSPISSLSLFMPPNNKPRAREPNATPPAEPEATPDESIKRSCRIALNAFHSGNQRRALTMINESYQKCGLVQHTKATILFEAFFQLEDRSLQDFSLKSAVSAAKEAVSWSPKSIEFAQFYCFLFFLNSDDDKAYAKLEEDCRYALSIEDPIYLAEESVQEKARQSRW